MQHRGYGGRREWRASFRIRPATETSLDTSRDATAAGATATELNVAPVHDRTIERRATNINTVAHARQINIDHGAARLADEMMMLFRVRIVLRRTRAMECRDDAGLGKLLHVAVHGRRRDRRQPTAHTAIEFVSSWMMPRATQHPQQRVALWRDPQSPGAAIVPQPSVSFGRPDHGLCERPVVGSSHQLLVNTN